jgi:putative GTP pyrophosphokinase
VKASDRQVEAGAVNYIKNIRDAYVAREGLLQTTADALEARLAEALEGVRHVDRVTFRVKSVESFVRKCTSESGEPKLDTADGVKYSEPLEEIEDQIAGRVLVFFRRDLEVVEARIRECFRAAVEFKRREPASAAAFGYESDHFVFVIDEHIKADGWADAGAMPTTFELQVRTLFMHAYAEPQHDLGYKGDEPLDSETERQFAWIAASAWGADRTMNELYEKLSKR